MRWGLAAALLLAAGGLAEALDERAVRAARVNGGTQQTIDAFIAHGICGVRRLRHFRRLCFHVTFTHADGRACWLLVPAWTCVLAAGADMACVLAADC